MNDFTKEELEKLGDIIDDMHGGCIRYESSAELRKKIQSMIDNYCEHKNQYTDGSYFSGCADCGRKW